MAEALRDLFKNEIIRASAGTGKTFKLSNRYLTLLASGASCETILAATFTRKGAGEILDRIVQRLAAAALSEEAATKLSGELGWQLDQARAGKILHDFLANLHLLEIGTLDSFFNRVAKAFSLELGLPPTWDIVELQQTQALHDEAIQDILGDDNISDLLHLMEKGEAQRKIATLIRDTVARIYSVFRQSTPEAWDQLPEVTTRLTDDELEKLVARIQALDCIKQKSFKEHWQDKISTPASEGRWMDLVETTSFQNFLEGNYAYGRMKFPPAMTEIYKQVLPHCVAILTSQLIWQNRSTCQLLQIFGNVLEQLKNEKGQLGFEDVTARLVDFVSLWNTDQFAFRLDHQIHHLLLDEFQDTSLTQWNVIRPFALKVTQDDPKRSFFCVGDLKQAIYRWRGGVAEIFNLIERELPNISDADSLTQSYRSSPAVIDLVNEVFGNLQEYRCDDDVINEAIAGWSEWFEKHTTVKTFDGYTAIEIAKDCDDAIKRQKGNNQESVIKARNRNVMDAAFERIKRLHKNIPEHQSIGVLFRTNAGVAKMIFRLQREGIPASEEGGTPITDSAAVELILSALQLADHPNDSIARFHLSHSPIADEFGLEPEVADNQAANRQAAELGAARIREALLLDGFGPTIERLAKRLIPSCTTREVLRLQQLVRLAFESDSSQDRWILRPSKYVEYIRNEVKVSDESSARIRVMTIHQSKGLEFDVVVLPMEMSANDFAVIPPAVITGRDRPTDPIKVVTRYVGMGKRKLLPESFQQIFDDDRQSNVRESMCLLYVALTRAVHAVHMVFSYGAKPENKSAEAVLLSTLLPLSKEKGYQRTVGIAYEHGNPLWYKSAIEDPEPDTAVNAALEVFYLPDDCELKQGTVSKASRSGRGQLVTSPSQLGGVESMRLGEIFERRENSTAARRGTIIHGCFELIRWLEFDHPDTATISAHLKQVAPWIANYSEYIDQFEQMLARSEIRELLTKQTYLQRFLPTFVALEEVVIDAYRVEVQTERPFAVKIDDQLVQGKIDRLVLVYEAEKLIAADICDFKTDSAKSQQDEILQQQHVHQVNVYRKAVSRFTGLPFEKVSGRLVFVESGRIASIGCLDGEMVVTESEPNQSGRKTSANRKKNIVPTPKHGSSGQLKLWDE